MVAVIEGCLRQDRECQRVLYLRNYGWALRIVFRYIGEYEEAREVVHNSFVRLFRSFDQVWQGEGETIEARLPGWMRDGVVYAAVDWVRKRSGLEGIVSGEGGELQEIWSESPSGEDTNERVRYKALIIQLVVLPEALRLAFNLVVIDGYTPGKAAALLGISERRLARNLKKARYKLRAADKSEDSE